MNQVRARRAMYVYGGADHLLVIARDAQRLQKWIEQGLPLDERNDRGWTALTRAAWASDHGTVENLLAAGANPLAKNGNDLTAEETLRLMNSDDQEMLDRLAEASQTARSAEASRTSVRTSLAS